MKRIRELRQAKGISQQALADQIHVTQQSVFKYEHDAAEPDIDILMACADYFGTSVDYIIEYTDVTKKYEELSKNGITREEKRILEYYRKLSARKQELLQELLFSDDEE